MLFTPPANELISRGGRHGRTSVLQARGRVGVEVMGAALPLSIQPDALAARLTADDAKGVVASPALHSLVMHRTDPVRPIQLPGLSAVASAVRANLHVFSPSIWGQPPWFHSK